MDPHAVLGIESGASPEELLAAYRRQAKRWHPDRAPSPDAQLRMADVNAAYEILRSGLWQEQQRTRPAAARPGLNRAGAWLPDTVRHALGPELLRVLVEGEPIELVTPAATWASPRTLLAVTGHRLLWLLDDAPVHRVRSLRFREVEHASHRIGRMRRDIATLHVRTKAGRRLSFAELRPDTAVGIRNVVVANED